MNRPLTAVFAALESLLVVGIGVGVPVVLLTFVWAFQYGLQIDWSVFWRVGADGWLVGHGADLALQLSASEAAAIGVTGASAGFVISIAALGFAVSTALLGARAGRRIAETRHRGVGTISAIAVFAVLAAVVAVSARVPLAVPSLAQGIVFPTLIYGVPLLAAAEVARRRRGQEPDRVTGAALAALQRIPTLGLVVAGAAARIGVAVVVGVLAFGGVVVALLLLTHYAQIVSLFEGTHAGLLGGLVLTLGQIALIPNLVVWCASWFVGPGFAIGTGSSVSPLGTSIGPMPSIPFLGALPTSDLTFGFVGILAPVGAAFVITTLLRPRIEKVLAHDDTLLNRVLVGVCAGVVAGVVLGLLSALSGGSAGPGRLSDVGPNGLVVGAVLALEVAAPAVLAMIVSQPAWATKQRSFGDLTDLGGLRDAVARARGERGGEGRGDETSGAERGTAERSTGERHGAAKRGTLDDAGRADDTSREQDDIPTERLDGFRR